MFMDIKIECPICMDYFFEPKVLPCGHTFCYVCLLSIKKDSKLTCPECNRRYENISLNSLPRNYILESIIDSHKESLQKRVIELQELPNSQEKNLSQQEEDKEEKKKPVQKNNQIEEVLLDPVDDLPQVEISQNSGLVLNLCKCNTYIIIFLLILNSLSVTHTQVIIGIIYRVAIFISSVFGTYKVPLCTQNLLDWQLTWFISNLFMSIFSYYRLKLSIPKVFRVLVSFLFYVSGLVLCYFLYTGFNESYFVTCGGETRSLTTPQKSIFFSDLALNAFFFFPYSIALIIGCKLKAEDN